MLYYRPSGRRGTLTCERLCGASRWAQLQRGLPPEGCPSVPLKWMLLSGKRAMPVCGCMQSTIPIISCRRTYICRTGTLLKATTSSSPRASTQYRYGSIGCMRYATGCPFGPLECVCRFTPAFVRPRPERGAFWRRSTPLAIGFPALFPSLGAAELPAWLRQPAKGWDGGAPTLGAVAARGSCVEQVHAHRTRLDDWTMKYSLRHTEARSIQLPRRINCCYMRLHFFKFYRQAATASASSRKHLVPLQLRLAAIAHNVPKLLLNLAQSNTISSALSR